MPAKEGGIALPRQRWGLVIVVWLAVSVPLAWGVLMTLKKAVLLFEPGAGS